LENALTDQKFTPYEPGDKAYALLSPEQEQQLSAVRASIVSGSVQKPCRVKLENGQIINNVYVAEAKSYIKYWGAWPEDDPAKRSLNIAEVSETTASPNALPMHLADEIAAIGENCMGGVRFALTFSDNSEQVYECGNLIDFLQFPAGKTAADVVGVKPIAKPIRDKTLTCSEYYWCLYSKR
jgi:hypothetical protein